jgi:hypothetical protein
MGRRDRGASTNPAEDTDLYNPPIDPGRGKDREKGMVDGRSKGSRRRLFGG